MASSTSSPTRSMAVSKNPTVKQVKEISAVHLTLRPDLALRDIPSIFLSMTLTVCKTSATIVMTKMGHQMMSTEKLISEGALATTEVKCSTRRQLEAMSNRKSK